MNLNVNIARRMREPELWLTEAIFRYMQELGKEKDPNEIALVVMNMDREDKRRLMKGQIEIKAHYLQIRKESKGANHPNY